MEKRLMVPSAVLLLSIAVLMGGCTSGGQVNTTAQGGDCNPGATTITLGSQLDGWLSPGKGYDVYCLFVPEGTPGLVVTLFGLEADFDLYVSHDDYEGVLGNDFDWSSETFGLEPESLTITDPQPGHYYVQVYDWTQDKSGGAYTLFAGTGSQCDPRAIPLLQGNPTGGLITHDTASDVYCIYVPSGSSELRVTLHDLQADFDLYMGFGNYSSIDGNNYGWSSTNLFTENEGITVTNPQPGYYYVSVTANHAGNGAYTIMANIS